MCRNARIGIVLLVAMVLAAMNFACGGGGLPPSHIVQSSQVDGSVSQSLQAAILGFVYVPDASEVRPINGISGASTQGLPLVLPTGVTGISFAPGQESAIVERANGASLGVISFQGAGPGAFMPIPGGVAQPNILAFSPNGASVALYSASEGQVQVVAGLPDQPQLTRTLASGELPDTVQALAIADDGLTLLEGTVHGAVYLLSAGGPQLVESVSDLGGIVFNPKSNNALIFDRSGGTLSLLQNVSTLPANRPLAGGMTGLGGTIGLQSNGRSAVIASTSTNHLWEVDLQSLQVQELQLPTTPLMLTPLRTSGDYLLFWQPGQLAWIVDTNQPKGAVYLVPAAAQAQSLLAR